MSELRTVTFQIKLTTGFKKISGILLLMFFCSLAYSQEKTQDVIYLKNGSIVRGKIVKLVPDKTVKIKTADNNIFKYQMEMVEKITKEAPVKSKFPEPEIKRFEKMFELGFSDGTTNLNRMIKVNYIHSLRLNSFLTAGAGTGIRYFYHTQEPLIPLLAEIRLNFSTAKITNYIALSGGYSFDPHNQFYRIGYLFTPHVGFRFDLNNNKFLHFGVGLELQQSENIRDSRANNLFGINTGFTF